MKHSRTHTGPGTRLASLAVLALLAGARPTLAQEPPLPPEPRPIVKLTVPDPIAFAPNSSAAFTLRRAQRGTTDLPVDLEIGGTAVNGTDYAELPTQVTIPAGIEALDLVVRPLANAPLSVENKTVVLTVRTNAAYLVGTRSPVTATLVQDLYNNDPPHVTVTAPAEGSVVRGPVLQLSADAADVEDGVASVSFFVGDTLVGVSTTPPFQAAWTNRATNQRLAVFAKAVDKIGQTTLSPVVNLTLTNAQPTVTLTSPRSGASVSSATVTLGAAITGNSEPLTRVDFVVNGSVVGSVATPPYTFTLPKPRPGTYPVTVRAHDAYGLAAESPRYTFSVANAAPVVQVTAPTNGAASGVAGGITFAATATDADSAVNRVVFYVDHKVVGTATNAPYQFTWAKPTVGSHLLIARAYDDLGAAANSPGITFGVTNVPPVVRLSVPAQGQVVTLPAVVPLAANVTPGEAPVVLVNFWANSRIVGSATNAPFTANWTNPPAGTYKVSAHVKDALGVVRVSPAVTFQVKAPMP